MINFEFIGALEGAAVLTGYVPNPEGSQSGVTCATGFDLGGRTVADLRAMGLSPGLVAKLAPYLGKKKGEAVAKLKEKPLKLTIDECKLIDAASHKSSVEEIQRVYDKASDVKFMDLPAAPRTVIASVAFQYGANLARSCPRFWKQAITQDWTGMLHNLENFGDGYPTRRRAEAKLLKTAIGH